MIPPAVSVRGLRQMNALRLSVMVWFGALVATTSGCSRGREAESPEVTAAAAAAAAPSAMVGAPLPPAACGSEAWALLVQEALARGLQHRPEIAGELTAYRERLVVEALLEEAVYAEVTVSADNVREWFTANRERYSRPRQIRVHHWHFPASTGAPVPTEQARALAERLERSPESALGELAEQLKGQELSGRKWGDLGFFGRGRFSPELEERLFALEPQGRRTAVVESREGADLYYLMADRPGYQHELDEVFDRVWEDLLQLRRSEAVARLVADLTRRGAGGEMVAIAGGQFWAGSTESEIDSRMAMAARLVGRVEPPRRSWYEDEEYRLVRVRALQLDRTEVTVARFRAFLAEGGPLATDFRAPLSGEGDLPAVGLSWEAADAYCRWVGKRLPTADEWEFAARGAQRRPFPWGDSAPDGSRGNFADRRSGLPWADPEADDGHSGPAPVGNYPKGATPEGVLDLGGNAREWTASAMLAVVDPADGRIYSWRQRGQLPGGEQLAPVVMYQVKGGAFDSAADDLWAADVRALPPDRPTPSLGFRCARDAD